MKTQKLFGTLAAACALATLNVQAVETEQPPNAASGASAEAAPLEEEDEVTWFEVGFDNDLLTGYVWRNSIVNDEPVWQPCVWGEFTRLDPVTLGFYIWQNWDLTKRRKVDGMPRAMNETDYNVHIGATLWESDDEEWSFGLELGHEWYTYRPLSGYHDAYPASYEVYLKATFDNPFVGVYGQYSQAYHPVNACHFEVGLTKEVVIGELLGSENDFLNKLSFGADWNMNFGSGKYLSSYLYDMVYTTYEDEDGEEWENAAYLDNNIGGTTIRFNLAYAFCDNVSLGLVCGYTAVLNKQARDTLADCGYCSTSRQLVWGGVQLKLSY